MILGQLRIWAHTTTYAALIISIQGGASDLGGESSASAESDDVSTKNDYNDYDEIVHADNWDRQ